MKQIIAFALVLFVAGCTSAPKTETATDSTTVVVDTLKVDTTAVK